MSNRILTDKQLQALHDDIHDGISMIVRRDHYAELCKALAEYGCHKDDCEACVREDDDECDCGLGDILKKAILWEKAK